MLGIPDFWVWSAYLLCIASTLLCVVYGVRNWNKGAEDESKQIDEEMQWEKAEDNMNLNL